MRLILFYTSTGRITALAAFLIGTGFTPLKAETTGTAVSQAETTATVSATTETLSTALATSATLSASSETSATKEEARSTTAPLLQRVRINYDNVAPHEDATRESLAEASTLSKNAQRAKWLASVAHAQDFRETTSPQFTNYEDLKTTVSRGEDHLLFPTPHDMIAPPPAGVLNGKLMFLAGGHGWTNDNTSTSLWYTQRPETNGMVEDMGNLDQMSIFADMCFRAGATVIPLRPVGFQHVERVVDNDSPRAFFQGAWADGETTTAFSFAGAKVPYRFARASAVETAVARFVPVIPEPDIYPVYAWARDGADRISQTYRIRHAGGINEVDIDHRKVGKGWIYLGQYRFNAGQGGYVEVTNKVRNADSLTTDSVVIADAIRFGNGMSDVNRGGGISGFPREEEASKYWVERSLPLGTPPFYEANPENGDQSNNVGTGPRMAAYMNRESEGNFFDRVYLSFHSNAVGGRGFMGLYNAHAIMRPDHQIELAKLTAEEFNAELTSAGLSLPKPWTIRRMKTQAHINFGEIRRDYINNEMSATILENAFHDNPDDAELMRKLSIRESMARATFRAAIRYFKETGKNELPVITPPDRPVLISLTREETTGNLKLRWQAAKQDPLSEESKYLRYRVYESKDGFAFDSGTEAGVYTDWTAKNIPTGEQRYYRVTAVNEAGESLPSQVFGASVGEPTKRLLFVHGTDLPKDDTAVTKTVTANLGAATRPGGSFVRIIQRIMDTDKDAPAVIQAAAKSGYVVDTISANHLTTNAISLDTYQVIAWDNGRSAVCDNLASTATLEAVEDYLTSGGKLLVSGARLNRLDTGTTDSIERWNAFGSKILGVDKAVETTITQLIKVDGEKLTTQSLDLRNRALRYFDPRPTVSFIPEKTAQPIVAYERFGHAIGSAAIANKTGKDYNVITVGFPLSEIRHSRESETLIGQFLELLNPTPEIKKSEPKKENERRRPANRQSRNRNRR